MLVKVQLFGEYVFGSKTRRIIYQNTIYVVPKSELVRNDYFYIDDSNLTEESKYKPKVGNTTLQTE